MRAYFAMGMIAAGLAAVACSGSDSTATSGADAGGEAGAREGGTDATSAGDAPPPDASDGGIASDADNGAPSSIYPAFHPPVPQIAKGSGNVMASPHVRVITFAGDALASTVADTMTAWTASSAWTAQTAEYGIGQATVVRTTLATAAPATLEVSTPSATSVEAWVTSQLDGTHAELGPVDAATLKSEHFLFVLSEATQLNASGVSVCTQGLLAYHDVLTLPSGALASYSMVPRCPAVAMDGGGLAQSDADIPSEVTFASTATTMSAIGDPDLYLSPGFNGFDDDHFAWYFIAPQEELASACLFGSFALTDGGLRISRSWSNASIAAGHHPCVPAPSDPYFVSVPVMTDVITMPDPFPKTKGVLIPVGESHTIDVLLSSDAPTGGPWSVTIAAQKLRNAGTLDFAFDRTSGTNGEKLHLTITAKTAGSTPFVITSTLGTRTTRWAGVVGQH